VSRFRLSSHRRLLYLIAGWVFVSSGCHELSSRLPFCHKSAPPLPGPSATVDVGGLVSHPSRLEIPQQGLTLRRALALAGQTPNVQTIPYTSQSVSPQTLDSLIEAWKNRGKTATQLRQLGSLDEKVVGASLDELNTAKASYDATANSLKEQLTDDQWKIVGQLRLEPLASQLGGSEQTAALLSTHPELPQAGLPAARESVAKLTADINAARTNALAKINLESGVTSSIASVLMVALNRNSGDAPATYYIPYDAASTTQAGEIALADGDLVQVVDYHRTGFTAGATNPLAGTSGPIVVQGLVRGPGTTTGGSISTVLISANVATADNSAVVTVERNSGAAREVFVIPLTFAQGGAMSDFAMRGGDVCTVTTMPRVPIVFHGLVTQTLRANGILNPGNRIITPGMAQGALGPLHDQQQQQVQNCINNADNVTAQALRNLQSGCKTLQSRAPDSGLIPGSR
jgi:hypothetical protein